MQISAFSLSSPPFEPVSAITVSPSALPTSAAATQFAELPEVLMQSSISPVLPNPISSCAYTSCGSTSLQNAELSPVSDGSGIAGTASCNFESTSSLSVGLSRRIFLFFRIFRRLKYFQPTLSGFLSFPQAKYQSGWRIFPFLKTLYFRPVPPPS